MAWSTPWWRSRSELKAQLLARNGGTRREGQGRLGQLPPAQGQQGPAGAAGACRGGAAGGPAKPVRGAINKRRPKACKHDTPGPALLLLPEAGRCWGAARCCRLAAHTRAALRSLPLGSPSHAGLFRPLPANQLPQQPEAGNPPRESVFEAASLVQPGPLLLSSCIYNHSQTTINHRPITLFPCWNSIEKEDGSIHRPPSLISLDFFLGKEARGIFFPPFVSGRKVERRLPLCAVKGRQSGL